MESLKRALEQLGRLWANLSATQRVVLSAAAVLMMLLLVWGSTSATPGWVRIAGAEVDSSRRASIVKKLQERNQKYEVRGNEICVPKEDADRVVLELAGEGAMSNDAVYKFLEQSDIFATRWDKEKRFQVALQSRLEGMIRGIESVRNAAVVINPGSTSNQLGFVGAKPSASVQVDLKEGATLSRKNVQAIAGLVARAVAVEEDQVLITDTKGISYRAAKPDASSVQIDTIREFERVREQEIATNIKDSLRDSWGVRGASAVVRIQANIRTMTSEQVTNDRPVVIEATDKKRVVKKGAGGSTGVRKGEGDQATESAAAGEETETEQHEKSVPNSKRTREDTPAGEIQRITVGVLIPVEEGAPMAAAQRELPGLRNFVLAAAGPQARMEDISVQLIPTKKPEPVAAIAEADKAALWISANWLKIVLGLLALAGFIFIVRIIQVSSAKDTVEELQALTTALSETREAQAELALAGEGDLGKLKQGLQDMVARNPQGVATSLKSFMSGR
jgi:flagellar biosynthesis/type III secretory pathway M-ring protein FliF/YscJ